MLPMRITIAREEFITLCVAVQKCSDAQLNAVKIIAVHEEASQDARLLAEMGDAVSSMGLVNEILKAVMDPGPPAEGGQCNA